MTVGNLWGLGEASGLFTVGGAETRIPYANVWKIEPTNKVIWSYDTAGGITQLPDRYWVAGVWAHSTSRIYVCGDRVAGKTVWALDGNGKLRWSFDTGQDAHKIITDSTGQVFVIDGTLNNVNVHALTSDGVARWSLQIPPTSVAAVRLTDIKIDADNAVLVTPPLTKISNDGVVIWQAFETYHSPGAGFPRHEGKDICFLSNRRICTAGSRFDYHYLHEWIDQGVGTTFVATTNASTQGGLVRMNTIVPHPSDNVLLGNSLAGGFAYMEHRGGLPGADHWVPLWIGSPTYPPYDLSIDENDTVAVASRRTVGAADPNVSTMNIDGVVKWTYYTGADGTLGVDNHLPGDLHVYVVGDRSRQWRYAAP